MEKLIIHSEELWERKPVGVLIGDSADEVFGAAVEPGSDASQSLSDRTCAR